MQSPKKTVLVSAIKNGTAIDHIRAGAALTMIRFLNLASQSKLVTVGLNLPSRFMKRKDLIKVADWEITPEQANQVALLAPNSTVNIIHNYAVVKKFSLSLPETIGHLLVCPNPQCVTNHEPVETLFTCMKAGKAGKDVEVTCTYCEKTFVLGEIQEFRT